MLKMKCLVFSFNVRIVLIALVFHLFQGEKACILSNENKVCYTMVASVLVCPSTNQMQQKMSLFQKVSRGHFQPPIHPLRLEAPFTGCTAQKKA